MSVSEGVDCSIVGNLFEVDNRLDLDCYNWNRWTGAGRSYGNREEVSFEIGIASCVNACGQNEAEYSERLHCRCSNGQLPLC